jgi:acylphosphatase
MPITEKIHIKGDVTGVGFKALASRAAARYNVTGYVKTINEDTVEVVLQGAEGNVGKARIEIELNPGASRVKEVVELPVEEEATYDSFSIVR